MATSFSSIEQQLLPLLQQLEKKRQLLRTQLKAAHYKMLFFQLFLIMGTLLIGCGVSLILDNPSLLPIFILWSMVMGGGLLSAQWNKHQSYCQKSYEQLATESSSLLYQHLFSSWDKKLTYEAQKLLPIASVQASSLFPKANKITCSHYWSGTLTQGQQVEIALLELKERVPKPTPNRGDAFIDLSIFEGLFFIIKPKAVTPLLEQDLLLKTYRLVHKNSSKRKFKEQEVEDVLDSNPISKNQYLRDEVEEMFTLENSAFFNFQNLPPYLKQQFLRWYNDLGSNFSLSIIQNTLFLGIKEEVLFFNIPVRKSLIHPSITKRMALILEQQLLLLQELEQLTSSPTKNPK